jgi:hypothetical protein
MPLKLGKNIFTCIYLVTHQIRDDESDDTDVSFFSFFGVVVFAVDQKKKTRAKRRCASFDGDVSTRCRCC